MTFLQRFFGIVLFRPITYRSVASNSSLTVESFLIVFLIAFLNSIFYTLLSGFGIQNTQERITLLYGAKATINWQKGTEKYIEINLPSEK